MVQLIFKKLLGSISKTLFLFSTFIFLLINKYFLNLFNCSVVPALLIILSYSLADPSSIGISGESISIIKLSMLLPFIAASKCSTVNILASEL